MSNYEATKYDFNGSNLTGIEGIPTATIVPWTASSVPTGFLECNGAAVSRSTYSALFAVIASTYGGGDGSSTFNVPDLQNKVAVSKSNNKALASTGGADTVAVTPSGNVGGSTANASLSTAQPSGTTQTQPLAVQPGILTGSTNTGNAGSGTGHSHNMSATFSGTASNPSVLQPYLTLIYIIKT